MAVYNAQATIAVALRSVLAQTRQADEIIIVDDGSTDDTGHILQDFSDPQLLRVIRLPENSGITAALNAGLDECNCDWVARIDADDWWDKHHLETLEHALIKVGDNTSLVATRARYWNEESHETGESCGPMHGNALRCFMLRDNPFVHSATLFRLEAAHRAGDYPGSIRWEDYGLWIALLCIGNAVITNAITVNCRKYTGSLSSVNKLVALRERLLMQQQAWRQFRHACLFTGFFHLASTWVRVSFAAAGQRLLCQLRDTRERSK